MQRVTIDETADVAEDVSLGEHVVIAARVRVGSGTTIGHGVVIHADTQVGRNVTVYDNAVLGRPPQGTGTLRRSLHGGLAPLVIGDGCVVGACAVLYRGTSIGSRVLIGDLASVREECLIGDDTIIARAVTVNYNTRIGHHTKIMDNTHITGDMVIEDHVFVGPLVVTTNENSMGRDPDRDRKRGGPTIRHGASIGGGASLLPNVIIGEYSIVASGAVVRHDVPPRMVVAGVPARVIKDVPPAWLPADERSKA